MDLQSGFHVLDEGRGGISLIFGGVLRVDARATPRRRARVRRSSAPSCAPMSASTAVLARFASRSRCCSMPHTAERSALIAVVVVVAGRSRARMRSYCGRKSGVSDRSNDSPSSAHPTHASNSARFSLWPKSPASELSPSARSSGYRKSRARQNSSRRSRTPCAAGALSAPRSDGSRRVRAGCRRFQPQRRLIDLRHAREPLQVVRLHDAVGGQRDDRRQLRDRRRALARRRRGRVALTRRRTGGRAPASPGRRARGHSLGLAADHVVGVAALRHREHAEVGGERLPGSGRRRASSTCGVSSRSRLLLMICVCAADRRLAAGGIGVEREDEVVRVALEQRDLALGQRRPHRRDDVRVAVLVRRDHVHVALDDDRARLRCGWRPSRGRARRGSRPYRRSATATCSRTSAGCRRRRALRRAAAARRSPTTRPRSSRIGNISRWRKRS